MADDDEAIRLHPRDTAAYYNRGNVWSDKGEYDRAIADYDQAIRLNPRDAAAHYGRAWLSATSPEAKYRDGKRAVESATTACELNQWNDPIQLNALAAAFAEAGDSAAAVTWQEKAVALAPGDQKEDYRSRLELYRGGKPHPGAQRELPEVDIANENSAEIAEVEVRLEIWRIGVIQDTGCNLPYRLFIRISVEVALRRRCCSSTSGKGYTKISLGVGRIDCQDFLQYVMTLRYSPPFPPQTPTSHSGTTTRTHPAPPLRKTTLTLSGRPWFAFTFAACRPLP